MKTLLLILIIITIGVSSTTIVFVYQYQQNCRTEGGSLVEPLTCDKTNYELIMDLFQKKYVPQRGSITDMVNGAVVEMTAANPQGDSVTLIIKEKGSGPYYAEIACRHKDSGKIETINKDVLDYLQNENCFVSMEKEITDVGFIQRIKTDQYLLEISTLQGNYIQNEEILFYVHEKGFDIRCFSVYAEVYDSSGNKIWEQPSVEECPPGLGESNFDHKIPFSGIKIGKPGEYRLVVQSRGYEISHTFSVLDGNLIR